MSNEFTAKAVTSIDEIDVPERSPRIERVPFVDVVQGVVCCNALFFLPTHYANKRGRVCLGPDKCPWHKTTKLVPYYLVALYVTKEHKVTWYQLPPSAAKQLLFGAKVLDRSIYGATVTVKRKWKAMNAPVIVSIDPSVSTPGGMPKPLTPEKSIRKCFGTAGSTSKTGKKAVE
jgi:hypothetical protein